MNRSLLHPVLRLQALALLLQICFGVGCASGATPASNESEGTAKTASGNDHEPIELQADRSLASWKYIVLHHTATDSGSLESINATHQKRIDAGGNRWRGIGYHFLIGNGQGMPDGQIQPTFRWREQSSGAHAGLSLYNQTGIGICLVGNFDKNGPTSAQIQAVSRLVSLLKAEFGITTDQVLKHGDLKATACPGRHFPFEQIASTPAAGPQLAIDNREPRFTPAHAEGVWNVVSVLRSTSRQP